MLTHHQLQKTQFQKGWNVAIDGKQFLVIDNGYDEECRRIYTLRGKDGEQRTMLRASALDLLASGRLRLTPPGEAALIGKIEIIRDYAKRGHSFSFTAQLLGTHKVTLRRALAGTDIRFGDGGQSLAMKRHLADLHESMRGRTRSFSEEALAAMARGREKIREKKCKKYTAFGVTGYIPDLVKHFGCPVRVESVRVRLRKGMTIEDALILPARKAPRGVVPPQFEARIASNRRRTAAAIRDAIDRKLTPTMLQFRAPEHDIVATGRKDARITVEVRTNCGTVLHSLCFIADFSSGVLFAFNSNERGRFDFIAFEPDSPALISSN